MAFKVWDGFDHYNNGNDLLARSGFLQWQNPTTPLTVSFVPGLTAGGAGKAIKIAGNAVTTPNPSNVLRAVWGTRNGEFYLGQRVLVPGGNINSPVSSFCLFLQDTVAGAPQFTIYFNANNYAIQVFKGGFNSGTTLGLSANNVWTGDASQFIEVHCKVDGSAGIVEVRVGGVAKLTITGADTQSTANAWCDAVDYSPFALISGVAGWMALDDLYYADTTAGPGAFAANTYAGDVRVATLFATGNQSVSWSPNPNTNQNWQNVSETAMDGDTTYNATATPGNEDLLAFQALTGTIADIFGLQITIAARKDDAGIRTLEYALKSGSAAEQYGGAWSVPDTYAYWTDAPVILDPSTGVNWTTTGVNAAFYGYKLAS